MNKILRKSLVPALVGMFLLAAAPSALAGGALALDGANDHVTFGPAPALGASNITLETWFRRSGAGVATSTGSGGVSAVPLVTKGRSEGDNSNVDMNYFLGIRGTDNVLVADFEEGAGGASPGLNHPIAGVTPLSIGVWYHAAATYDGNKWQLFLNGALEAELIVGRPLRSDSIQHAALGTAINSTGVASGYFAGTLDEARIWNVARSPAQILAGRDVDINSEAGLVGRWGLDENSGTSAADTSGNNVTGTLVNGPLWVGDRQTVSQPIVTRGPYLQVGTASSIIVRWRTDTATDSRVRFGTSVGSLTSSAGNATLTTEHEVLVSGLSPVMRYYYSVGSSTATLASGTDYSFYTAPPIGTAQPTRVWVLGDSGTKDAVAAAVRNGYTAFGAGRYTDVWLMLGDNAYNNGTDAEFQAAVFDMYPSYLRQAPLWSTIGNHDTGQTTNPSLSIPYFQIFNSPTDGSAGGVPSGTERYYSFDYGRIHFISLDSMTSSRAPGSAMLTWLEADLGSTTQDWIIAFFHHPPYTKGSHNSDTESQLIEMRANVLPILEAGGVDLVLTGHSHSYERSFFINGHYGLSGTFTNAMKVEAGSGRENESGGAYDKPADLVANAGAVYVVAGNGGHVTNWVGGSTAEFNPAPHPAMYRSVLHVGSLVLDVDGNRLDAKMIRETGAVDDYFTLVKTTTQSQVPLAPATLSATAGNAQVSLSWAASSGATSYTVKRSTSNGGPYSMLAAGIATTAYTDATASNGTTYYYVVSASNGTGESPDSSQASATPVAPPAVPAAPTGLTATAISKTQVNLSWIDQSNNESGFRIERSTVSGSGYKLIATVGANTTSYANTGLKSRKTYYYRLRAYNASGDSTYSNTASAKTLK
ncbi:MAG: hypothetical protein A3E01_17650 [Gammaproteobacteria bacterium RIFCSPHIGHO2_12_FULL_63_22]|nr:MAG: hypothetical protein A3E01_17650 [Gammaproteobacteria bacterium RIFCSPHIGHO2_12_FULL_63_22]